MEKLDQAILSLLARDGRMSYTDIGKETGLSTSAAQQRVRRLEQRGVIKGYRAVLDPEQLNLMITAFVAIKPFDPSQPDDAPQRLEPIDEVISCYSVAGEPSYLLKVQVPTMAPARDTVGPHPRRRRGVDPHHHRAVHPVRGPSPALGLRSEWVVPRC